MSEYEQLETVQAFMRKQVTIDLFGLSREDPPAAGAGSGDPGIASGPTIDANGDIYFGANDASEKPN